MIKKIIFPFLVVTIFIFAVSRCTHETVAPVIPEQDTVPCFQTQVLPFFKSSCASSGCHNSTSKAGGYVLDNFQNITSKGMVSGNADGSRIYQVLVDVDGKKRMPKNSTLSIEQISMIKTWIRKGFPDDPYCNPDNCDSINVTYATKMKSFFDGNCISCHRPFAVFPDMTAIDTLHSWITSDSLNLWIFEIKTLVDSAHMGIVLTPCEKAQIRRWLATGSN
jgi:hypothetical protein